MNVKHLEAAFEDVHCWLTSLKLEFANQFAHLDTTQADVKIKMDGFAFLDI